MVKLTTSTVGAVPVMVPSEAVQHGIVERVREASVVVEAWVAEAAKQRRYMRGLAADLFGGRVRAI